ncbi:MAG TPA: FmdB family zinc ribbon protein [Pyrinomonadaceae bacterium]|jgi:putative FmdB family regulatory protein
MPIYEYTCQKCKAHIEIIQKISDKPLTRHSKCGGKLEREWSRTGFQFKGSGWYVTDYAGKKTEKKEDAKESKEGATEKKTEAAASSPADTSSKESASKSAEKSATSATKAAASKSTTKSD